MINAFLSSDQTPQEWEESDESRGESMASKGRHRHEVLSVGEEQGDHLAIVPDKSDPVQVDAWPTEQTNRDQSTQICGKNRFIDGHSLSLKSI